MSAVVFESARQAQTSVSLACRVLQVSRSTVYARQGRKPSRRSRETAALDVEVRAVFEENKGRYGSPRVHEELHGRGFRTSRKRVAQRMKAQNLRARPPKRFRRTTQADGSEVAPNLLERRFSGHGRNEVWVGDVTYIWTWQGWLYLAILVDLGTRAIVGWATSEHCDTDLCLLALERAVARNRYCSLRGLMHHTDRGSTYTADRYQKRMNQLGFEVSMSRKGNCWDNAVAESTIGTIKAELLAEWTPPTRTSAQQALFRYIDGYYNPRRRHSTLGYCTPIEMELSLLKMESAA